MRKNKWLLTGAVLIAGLFVWSAMSRLPAFEQAQQGELVPQNTDSVLARALAPSMNAHPNLSGLYPLGSGYDAFVARASLAAAAQHTLDVQYYIWHNDISGKMLFHALKQAADRGVRVRLLLDDNNTRGMDPTLQTLDRHANIEVRLFNPFVNRDFRALGYLTDFPRLNRRMHNKSFTADNQVSVVGGRNVGDEYFEVGDGTQFVDLDALVAGQVVPEITADFNRYWYSASVYPLASIVTKDVPEQALDLSVQEQETTKARAYIEALHQSQLGIELQNGSVAFDWVPIRLISDDPAKGLGLDNPETAIGAKIKEVLQEPQRELLLVSPYFVPTQSGVDAFKELRAKGVHVSVLTNSLDATNVSIVHSGYIKYRHALLDAGVQLFELKKTVSGKMGRDRFLTGSSASSLHAKTFSVDGQRVFIGSFNLDPRSARLNTEMGIVAEHPKLAQEMTTQLRAQMPDLAYQVKQDAQGHLTWQTRAAQGQEITLEHEPETGVLKRAWVQFLSWLPLERML